ncbi:MAG: hypothetical protein ACE367_04625 [Acidimicrobiales bacterium]
MHGPDRGLTPFAAKPAETGGTSAPGGERISLALRDALFEEGRDIGRGDVLADLAETEGLALVDGDERVRSSWETGLGRGVVGSPHFFTAGGGFFCPALHIERVDGHLRIAPDHDAFEAFVAAAVGDATSTG